MSAGTAPTLAQVNNQATQIVLNARNSLQSLLYFDMYLQTIGQDGLVALGMSADDATTLLTVYANLAAVANMCNGGAYNGPALPYNFLTSTAELWNGQ